MQKEKIGKCELYLGDCMELMPIYPDKYFDLAIVDPPYGIGMSKNRWSPSVGRGKAPRTEYKKKDWDNSRPNQKYFDELFRISKNCIIWGGDYFIDFIKMPSSGWIVWDKQNNITNFPMSDCEIAFSTFDKRARLFSYCWVGYSQGVQGRSTPKYGKEQRIHPTQKPVALYKWLLSKYAQPKNKILDTHLGSGSHAIACYDMGFELTACEIDVEYYTAALERLRQFSAQGKLDFE